MTLSKAALAAHSRTMRSWSSPDTLRVEPGRWLIKQQRAPLLDDSQCKFDLPSRDIVLAPAARTESDDLRSEVARAILPDWRGAMPAVHSAVDELVRDGLVQLR